MEDNVRERVLRLIEQRYGRAEEDLARTGIIDSVRAMELLIALQKEFDLALPDVKASDLASVSSIVAVLEQARAATGTRP